jgi:Mce-associated membrane protein
MADDAAAPDGELSEETAEGDSTEADKPASEGDGIEAHDSASEGDGDEAEVESAEPVDTDGADESASPKPRMSHVRLATLLGLAAVVALAGLCGWLGFRAYESRKAADERNLFLQVGRQGALNLTTIDFEHADADVQRILDSSTGTFYDDFQSRAQPFLEVVKQAKSKSVGTIAEAGLQSESDDGADVLVAVTVKSSNAGAAEQEPRAWRMMITVQKVGDDVKVSNVRFVS